MITQRRRSRPHAGSCREVELPVGAGVHTGNAWVGFVGGGEDVVDFTALGDAVNTASRLGLRSRDRRAAR